MHELVLASRYVTDLLFLALGLVALRHWRRRQDVAAGWVAATFGLLGTIIAIGAFLPTDIDGGPLFWIQKLIVVALVCFPYLLYRFAGTFEPASARLDRTAVALTGAVVLASVALPALPGPGEARPAWFAAYVALLLVQWTALSLVVAVRLWRGGRRQPTLTRRRMRGLCLASLLLNVGLVLAATVPSSASAENAATLLVNLVATASAVLFFGAFAPPALVRLAWRRPEEQALQDAQLQLMAATTPAEVVDHLLPRMTEMLGGSGAALVDAAGDVVGSFGTIPAVIDPRRDATTEAGPVRLTLACGTLLIWTSSHTPFFGREELGLLASFGVVADLAMARCDLLERQRQSAASLELANAELQREIRERTLAAERLTQSEQRLEEAQQIAHIGGWQWDLEADEVTWSDELYRIYGLEPQAFPPSLESFAERVPSEDNAVVTAAMNQARLDHQPFGFDHRVIRPDGTVRVVHVQGKVVVDASGSAVRMIGTAQDVTERKATEDALVKAYGRERQARMAFERTNGELESFVYSVSHDLKSPMISLLGYLDYLKLDFGKDLPQEAWRYLDRMSASGAYMQALIQDLLELSRVGRSATERDPVDLTAVVEDVVAEIRSAHPEMSVELEPLAVVSMNQLRARQLLTNLIGNAVDHGERPDVHVVVSAELQPEGALVVSVHDDGPGIPATYREKVFGVFERLSAREGSGSGTGIGLAICRKIMESLGGSIWIADSEVGTKVCASFPAELVERVSSGAPSRVGAQT